MNGIMVIYCITYLVFMSDGGIKQKMIQVSKKVYLKLQDKKHKLEKENECSWSFNDVIDYLLENQKNV